MSQKVVIIVQARMGSTRLPGKVMRQVLGRPLLSYLVERLARIKLAQEYVVATPLGEKEAPLVTFCQKEKIPFFQGAEEDVLDRTLKAARAHHADAVVRITSDCPLLDPAVADRVIDAYLKKGSSVDYASNTLVQSYPRGMDVEIVSMQCLEEGAREATDLRDREHVTRFFRRQPERYRLLNVLYKEDASALRLTVDTEEDFRLVQHILETLYPQNSQFTLEEILELLKIHPEWVEINAHVRQKCDTSN